MYKIDFENQKKSSQITTSRKAHEMTKICIDFFKVQSTSFLLYVRLVGLNHFDLKKNRFKINQTE